MRGVFHVEPIEQLLTECPQCLRVCQDLLHNTELGISAIRQEIWTAHHRDHVDAPPPPAPRAA